MAVKVEGKQYDLPLKIEEDQGGEEQVRNKIVSLVQKALGAEGEASIFLSESKLKKLQTEYGFPIFNIYQSLPGLDEFKNANYAKVCILKEDIPKFNNFLFKQQSKLYQEKQQNKIKSKLNEIRFISEAAAIKKNLSQIPDYRKQLFEFINSENPEIEKTALFALLEILENDPISQYTAKNLVSLQEEILERIQNTNLQHENTANQELLIRLYGVCLETILLHMAPQAETLSKVEKNTNRTFWDGASSLMGYYEPKMGEEEKPEKEEEGDLFEKDAFLERDETSFWVYFAKEAVKWIDTDAGLEDTLNRVLNLVKAGASIVKIAAGSAETGPELTNVVSSVKEAFAYIGKQNDWFASLLYIRKVSRLGLQRPCFFEPLEEFIQKNIDYNTEEPLLYGMVLSLEYAALRTDREEIQEACLKLLLQMMTMRHTFIQKKVFKSFKAFAACSHPRLSNTSKLILLLLKNLKKIPKGEVQLNSEDEAYLRRLFLENPDVKLNESMHQHLFKNVLFFFLKRFTEIRGKRAQDIKGGSEVEYSGQGFLALVASSQDIEAAKEVLRTLWNLSSVFFKPDIRGFNLYHYCVQTKNFQLLNFLQEGELNLDINAKDFIEENTPLHYAAKLGYGDMVESLLFHPGTKADPNIENKKGQLPLHLAGEFLTSDSESFKIIVNLFEATKKTSYLDHERETPLDKAIEKGDPFIVGKFLEQKAYQAAYVYQLSPIYHACNQVFKEGRVSMEQRLDVLKALIEYKLEKKSLFSPLEQIAVMKVVSKDGKTITCPDSFARFIYQQFFSGENDEEEGEENFNLFTGKLRKEGENFHIVGETEGAVHTLFNRSGEAIFTFQASSEHLNFFKSGNVEIKKLMECFKPVSGEEKLSEEEFLQKFIDVRTFMEISALHMAVIWGDLDGVKRLVDLGADVRAKDYLGMTPLHFACLYRKNEIIELLIEKGARKGTKNHFGETPLLLYLGKLPERRIETHISLIGEGGEPEIGFIDLEIIELFLEKKPKLINTEDKEKNNVLHHALIAGEIKAAELLAAKNCWLLTKMNKLGKTPLEEIYTREKIKKDHSAPVEIDSEGEDESFEEVSSKKKINKNLDSKVQADLKKLEQSMKDRKVTSMFVPKQDFFQVKKHLQNFSPKPPIKKENSKNILKKYPWEEILDAVFSDKLTQNEFLNLIDSLDAISDPRMSFTHMMAELNQHKILKRLFEWDPSRALLSDGTSRQETPMHRAVIAGSKEAVEIYLKFYKKDASNFDIYQPDGFGNTLAHLAIIFSQRDIFSLLQEKKYCFDIPNEAGNLPAHLVGFAGYKDCYKKILKEYALEANSAGEVPLHIAVRNQHWKTSEYLRKEAPESITKRNEDGNTPLHIAASVGWKDFLKSYFEEKKYFGIKNNFSESLLHLACQGRNVKVVNYLLEKGCDLSALNYEKENPLHDACFYQNIEIVEALLKRQLSYNDEDIINKPDIRGETPLQELLKKPVFTDQEKERQLVIFELMLDYGADVSIKNERGEAFLHLVCLGNHVQLLAHAIYRAESPKNFSRIDGKKALPISLTIKDAKGNTPLHYAVSGNNSETVIYLINALNKSDAEIKNKEGITALNLAALLGLHDLIGFFWGKDVSVTKKDKQGRNLLHHFFSCSKKIETDSATADYIQEIMKENPNLLIKPDTADMTPFHYLVQMGHKDWILIFLKHLPRNFKEKIDFLLTPARGKTPKQMIEAKIGEFECCPSQREVYEEMHTIICGIEKEEIGSKGGKLKGANKFTSWKKWKLPKFTAK